MDFLNSKPIIELSGEEFLPIEGKTFVQQVEEFFQKQGGVAHSAFGDVILDKKGIRNDFHHGMSPIKRSSFAAIKDVLESGVIVLPLDFYNTNNKKQLTGMIAAPIKISYERYVCIVEVIANTNKQRLYLHEAFLIKNLQEIVATSPVHDNNKITSRQPQGEIAKVLQNYVSANKGDINSGNLLNDKPIIELSGDEFLPKEGITFAQQVNEYFKSQGGKADSPFGEVLLDIKGIQNSKQHGMSRIKVAAFAAVKDVLEKGVEILPMEYHGVHDKKQMTGMIAAPIVIGVEKYICVVEVIANLEVNRLYVHEAFVIKTLFEDAASNSVHGSKTTSPHPQGEIAKVLQNYVCANKNILNDKIRLYDQENGTELARFVAFLERGKVYEGNEARFFRIGKTGELLQKYGMKGDITIGSSPFNERHSKDGHDLSIEDWTSIVRNINHPIAISKYTKRKMSYRIYVSARINGIAACVGTDVHSLGKNIEVTNISTVFWRDMEKAGQGEFEKLLYPET